MRRGFRRKAVLLKQFHHEFPCGLCISSALGFLLPFQLLLDEVELLMPLLPELLSQVLSFEQPAYDQGLT